MNNKNLFSIKNNDGELTNVDQYAAFKFIDVDQDFIVYTYNEKDDSDNTTFYISKIDNSNDNLRLINVNDDEYSKIKDVLRELSKDEISSSDILNNIRMIDVSSEYENVDFTKIKLKPKSVENVYNNFMSIPVAIESNLAELDSNENIDSNNNDVKNEDTSDAELKEENNDDNNVKFEIKQENIAETEEKVNENKSETFDDIISEHKKRVEDFINGKNEVVELRSQVAKSEQSLQDSAAKLSDINNQISFEENEIKQRNELLMALTKDQGNVVVEQLKEIEAEKKSLKEQLNENQNKELENNQKCLDGEEKLAELRNTKAEVERAIAEIQAFSSYNNVPEQNTQESNNYQFQKFVA